MKRNRRYILITAVLLLLPLLFVKFSYVVMYLCFCEIYIIAASGLDILYGYSGQISFATSAFFGIGAYGSLLMHNHLGWPIIVCMLVASCISAGIAMVFAWPVSKLRFAFLSLATISFNHIVFQLITRSPGRITGDFNGIFTDRMNLFGLDLKSYYAFYYFGLACATGFVVVKISLLKSRVGRAFLAIKQNLHAADGMGIDVRKYKIYAFGIYGFYAAFAGAMYVHLSGYVSPETVAQSQSVVFMIMILFGGVCSDWGPVIGAAGILLLTEILSFAQQYQLLVYGILLLIFIVFLPGGVVGEFRKRWDLKRQAREGSGYAER